jgi:hypothetical protein
MPYGSTTAQPGYYGKQQASGTARVQPSGPTTEEMQAYNAQTQGAYLEGAINYWKKFYESAYGADKAGLDNNRRCSPRDERRAGCES